MAQYQKRGIDTYKLTVSCGFDNQGKRQRKTKTIKLSPRLTEKQLQQELAVQLDKFEKEVQHGTYLDGGSITLNEFSEKWIKDYAEPNLKPRTISHYKQLLVRTLLALGHMRLERIQPTHIMKFYKNLGESGVRLDYKFKLKENISYDMPDFTSKVSSAKINPTTLNQILKGEVTTKEIADKICKVLKKPVPIIFDVINIDKKLSSSTIRHYHRLLNAMLNTATHWQLILSNPVERVKPPKVEHKEAKYYNIEEVHQMLILLESEPIRYRIMINIVIFCGLRLGELSNLEWSDIDFDKETISISKQLQYLPEFGVYEMESAKSESGNRTIAIDSTLTDLLKEYKSWQDNEKAAWGSRWVDSNKLFTQEDGKPIFPDTPSKWFKKFIKRHNLPEITFHQLRHTNASLLISQGVDPATVSRRLGHADVAVTLRTYTHAIKEYDREAANALGNLIKKKK